MAGAIRAFERGQDRRGRAWHSGLHTDVIADEGRALFDVVQARGMEGIVSKRLGSRYAPGRRKGACINV